MLKLPPLELFVGVEAEAAGEVDVFAFRLGAVSA